MKDNPNMISRYAKKSGVMGKTVLSAVLVLSVALYLASVSCGSRDRQVPSADSPAVDGSGYEILDTSDFARPSVKNSTDLVLWGEMAYRHGWGYVYGTFGYPLGESLLADKVDQYPREVGQEEVFIREHWLGRRTVDCMGLIKSYMWYDPQKNSISYNAGGMPDLGCDRLFEEASVKGTIDTLPEKKGVAVYAKGHIGIYIGGGYAIDARSTRDGVVKTKISSRKWTHWFEIPYIEYNDETR